MSPMIHVAIFLPLMTLGVLYCIHVKGIYRRRARYEIAFRAIDRASEAFRRIGVQIELTSTRIRTLDEQRRRSYHDGDR
jgi:hypothetical protein